MKREPDMVTRIKAFIGHSDVKLPTELHLHPDDYKALRDHCAPWLMFSTEPGRVDSFNGIPIVQDENAPRFTYSRS